MMFGILRNLGPLTEEAISALLANRLRSVLTMLGVIIGVMSVILMLAIGEGSRVRVTQSISSLGSNLLIVQSGSASSGGFKGGAGSLPNLTLEDAAAISELYSVKSVAPVSNTPVQVVYGAKNKSTSVTGTTPAYFLVNNMPIQEGDMFSDTDVRTAANVAVLGVTVVKELFGDRSPIGETIRIQRQTFQVIGVFKPKGQGFGGGDQDDAIILPVTTAQRKLSGSAFPGSVGMIMLESRYPEQKGYSEEEVRRLLRQRHRIASEAEEDFSVRDVSLVTETLRLTSQILSILLGSIAFICLLVGGIGIMNIMLVSVTERTREIGVRMALGASRALVLGQFLIEALLLSSVGAAIGLSSGFMIGWLIGKTGSITPIYSTSSIVLSISVAVLVGVVFGYWPARRAAQMQPVEALRQQ